MKKGTFCISIDTELLWGRWDLNYKEFEPKAEKVRSIIKSLLEIFKKYDVPATWAIVGNLYLEIDESDKGNKLWRAPDIIDIILENKKQEIACHSFTHPEFTKISQSEATEEINRCIKEAKKKKIKLNTFVYPRNKINHLSVLKQQGFKTFRGPEKYLQNIPNSIKKLYEIVDLLLLIPHTVKPQLDEGLVNIPGSMYYVSARGIRKYIPVEIRVLKAINGINSSIEKGEIFHLWFHPIDLADKTEEMLSGIEKIVKYANKKVKEGKLEIKTMDLISSEF